MSNNSQARRKWTYSGLEGHDLLVGEGVSLGNDGNQVDLGMKATHDLNIQRLKRVAGRLDEENASVDSVVHNVHTVDLVLGIQVCVISLLDVLDNGSPRLVVVHEITETRGIDNGEAETDTSLLDVCTDRLNSNGLGNDVQARSLALLGRVQGSVEQSVDQSGLSKARFT